MCGICGEIRFDGRSADVAAVARMTDDMASRGPDSDGVVAQGPIAFGHRRLSIIDLSPCGAQPMVDSDLGLTLVFNGCIYNHEGEPEVAIHHWLGAARGQVDDRQPAMSERDGSLGDDAVGIRAAGCHGVGHPGYRRDVGRSTVEADLAADTTHVVFRSLRTMPVDLARRSVSRCPCYHRRTTN